MVERYFACQGLLHKCTDGPDVYCCAVGSQQGRRHVAQGHSVGRGLRQNLVWQAGVRSKVGEGAGRVDFQCRGLRRLADGLQQTTIVQFVMHPLCHVAIAAPAGMPTKQVEALNATKCMHGPAQA